MSFLTKSEKFLKPFFTVLAFFILSLIVLPKNNQTVSLLPLELPEFDHSQNVFADPAKKARPESPEFVLIQENCLQAASPAITVTPQILGALIEGYDPEDINKTIVEYIVEPGDSLWAITSHFGVSLDTILWANDLNKNAYLQQGQKLIIPPVSGVIHHVKIGDTVSAIAQKYKGKAEEIIDFNNLLGKADIFIGDILIVPDGKTPTPVAHYAPAIVPLAKSYFICPISSPCRITQGLHWYNAIDFSHGRCGEPIYAAAAGTVQKVKLTNSTSRWAFGGAGNHLTILHPNGVVTMYGHIVASLVSPGEEVYQGQVIALMGGQPGTPGAGMSTGCHIHFGVSGARNPFAY
jgi:LysM repeat protein